MIANTSSIEQDLHRLAGLSPEQLERVISTAIGKDKNLGAYCDVYLQIGSSQGLVWDQGVIKSTSNDKVRGGGVRVVIGDRSGYSYTDHPTFSNLRKAAKTARSIAEYAKGVEKVSVEELEGTARDVRAGSDLYLIGLSPLEVGLSEKIDLLKKIDETARAYDPKIENVTASLGVEDYYVIIATSLGHLLIDRRPLVRLSVSCMAVDGNRRETGRSGGGGRVELEHFDKNGLWKKFTDEAAELAVRNLDAVPAPAGEMTVVLGNGWPGVLIHEAVGHGLEGDFNRKGTSAFSGRIGEKVASELCTVIDDGTVPGARGALNFDDEGTPTGETVLIEKGILKGYMQDRMNAGLMKTALTGSGRRQDYQHMPIPRMTNTYLAGGQHSPEEIISSVKRGVYAVTFGGGQVDITSGDFTFSATSAYLIEDGKITKPVKGATLIGNGPRSLHNVSMVGNDMCFDEGIGTCGKAGQSVPVCVGMPHVRMENVTVGGTGA